MTKDEFIIKATKKHGTAYDYSRVGEFVIHKDRISIGCPIHGMFTQTVNSHLLRSGCPACGRKYQASQRKQPLEYYLKKAQNHHNAKYDYSLLPPNPKATDKVSIICPQHGIFLQQLADHIRGHGCNECARELASNKTAKGLAHFLSRCKDVHGDLYSYELFPQNPKIKDIVSIICKKHGVFQQVLDCHLAGSGCPQCASTCFTSKPEVEIQAFLQQHNFKFETNTRKIIFPFEIDIFLPEYNLAIEYCGLYWHSETKGKGKQYHKQKLKKCNESGVRLLTIFEDEWVHRKDIVKTKILSILHKDIRPRVYARKCQIVTLTTHQKKTFLNTNHIQGDCSSSINIGLTYNNITVACMTFVKHQNHHYLTRYATSHHVIGGFTKLLKYFQDTNDWTQLVSFADLRWSDGHLYKTTGWVLDTVLPPDYSYVRGNHRFHKFGFRRKFLTKKLSKFNPLLSEKQNCDNDGLLRIWDCGKQRWVLNNC